jgi:hypothetical protein
LDEPYPLSARHLKVVLLWVIAMHGEVSEGDGSTSDIIGRLSLEGLRNVSLRIRPGDIETLGRRRDYR